MSKPTPDDFFTQTLLHWHANHHRPLPWKGEKDPYLVWLSEIILQQTRVEQGLPYFEKFKAKYPTVQDLADAPDDEVMKLWEGLGYYSRARNLLAAARFIAHQFGGVFPNTYEGLIALRGVGSYTAAAIASFAFDLPHAVVDGNVFRVLSRYFGISEPVDTSSGKKLFEELAHAQLDPARPGAFNQAIMDFGAGQCTPQTPRCPACPLRERCTSFQQNKVEAFPVKSKKIARRQRFFNYLDIRQEESVFIKKRTGKDIWRNLYEFPLIETDSMPTDRQAVTGHPSWAKWLPGTGWRLTGISPPFRQELTHQRIIALFWEIEAGYNFRPAEADWVKTERQNLENFAFPKAIRLYLKQLFLPLERI